MQGNKLLKITILINTFKNNKETKKSFSTRSRSK